MNILRRFHEEESGQLSFLAVAGVVCFIGLLSMVMNTDDIITERIRMQDIADTTAISSAAWTARGLNLISFINVLDAKLISTAVLLNALADTLPVVQRVGEIQLAVFNACSGVPFVGAFCAAMAVVVNIQLNVLRPLTNAVRKLADKLSRCGGSKKGLLWTFMNTLQDVATVVKNSFTLIGLAEGFAMAKANGADMGIVVNGKMVDLDDAEGGKKSDGSNPLSLPVVEAENKFKAFCPFVKNGGSGFKMAGYECGKGPFKLGKERINKTILVPFVNLFAHPIFIGMSAQHFTMVGCTPDKGKNEKFDVMLKDLAECKKYKGAEATWAHVYSKTEPLDESNLGHEHFTPWKPKSKQKGGKDDDDAKKRQGEVEEGVKDINIPPESEEDAVKRQFEGGEYYDRLQNEQTPMAEIPRKCDGNQAYPLYAPPEDGFDTADPGETLGCFLSPMPGGNCKRINTYSQFKWYSGEHKPGIKPENTGGYYMRVGKEEVEEGEGDNKKTKYVYIVETISLIDSGKAKMNQKQFEDYLNQDAKKGQKVDTSATDQTKKCTKPIPYVLDIGKGKDARKDFEDQLRFIAVVWRKIDKDPPFWSTYFKTPPKNIMAYGQAQVYNHLSEDTFTQDWRVRLEQASLFETLLGDDKGKALGSVGGFGAVIKKVNNH